MGKAYDGHNDGSNANTGLDGVASERLRAGSLGM